MFFSLRQISESLNEIVEVHPFYGITFLVCKAHNLPVGTSNEFHLDSYNKEFLDDHFHPAPESQWYYRPFRTSDKEKRWVKSDYASSGLQSINTRTFGNAFLHPKNSEVWGWSPRYVEELKSLLHKNKKIPAFHLSVWLYRERDWPAGTTTQQVLNTFLSEFSITDQERASLFDLTLSPVADPDQLFQQTVVTWVSLREITGPPPDAKPEKGGTLAYLLIQGVGPSERIEFAPAQRLNLITGDNGLGKTFILESAWWALTGEWADRPAYPRQDATLREPKITFQIAAESSSLRPITIPYDWKSGTWQAPTKRPTIPGLIVYARVDGSFAVWDPALRPTHTNQSGASGLALPLVFTRDQVWDGFPSKIEGLLRDWTKWQDKPDRYPFEVFRKVLRRLSPPDLGVLEPSEPVRLPGDSREIPTLRHSYGDVPIIFESAGVRRIITLAYLIVWAWNEHQIHAQHARREPETRMVVLIDEMEAHLHPQWQRSVLPALVDVREELSQDLEAQYIIATHSPLVMASIEPLFDEAKDKLFHLNLDDNGQVSFKELEFILYGPVDSWLQSEVFDLRQARSREAEGAIEQAKLLQKNPDPNIEDVRRVSDELVKYLSADDEFWPRWVYFAERHGVDL